jgi:ribosomal protein L10
MINAVSIPTEKEKVMRKRSTWQAPKERMVHRLKGCPGRWSWKVVSEPES